MYKGSGVLIETEICRKNRLHYTCDNYERVRRTDITEMFGFEITDVFKEEKINSIGGNLYIYNRSPSDKDDILKLRNKYQNILFEWNPEIYRWISKLGTDNDDLYLYIQSKPLMSYELFDIY